MDSSKIIYVKNERYSLFDGQKFAEAKPAEAKKYPVALLVPSSALYMYSSKLPTSLDDEQTELQMDIAMHEEGGADDDKDYSIALLKHTLPGEDSSNLVDLFGVTYDQADALYGNIVKQTKAIDIMVPAFLIYQALYKEEEATSTDLYIFFDDEEAYGVLFQNGKYIAHRIMDNLASLSAKTRMDLDTIKALLKTKGVQEENYTPEELDVLTTVQDYLTKGVERVVHTINHKRGLFNLDKVDKVFLDFDGAVIPGLEGIFDAFGIGISSILPLKAPSNEDPSLHHDIVAAIYLLKVAKGEIKGINLTPFERELPLYRQPAGYFLGILFIGLLFVGIGWFVLQMLIDKEQEKINTLDTKIAQATSKVSKATQMETKLVGDLKTLETKEKQLNEEDEKLDQTTGAISLFESSSIKRSQMVDNALMGLSQNNLGVIQMDQNGSRKLYLHIITTPNKQSNIANFMDFMSKRGYQRSFTKQIIRKDGLYESIVEIVR